VARWREEGGTVAPERPDVRPPSPRRALPLRRQLLFVGAVALAAAGLLGGRFALSDLLPRHAVAELAAPRATPGTFRPTKAEWSALELTTVRDATFRPSIGADGEIAIEGDRTTPVFSPYSGRVVAIYAKTGQLVEAGKPLMAVEATEIVEREDDLIGAVMALATARAESAVAQTAAARQHELYLAKGAALKDWQESEAKRTAAEDKLHTAETALAAARNRLAILGKSKPEIAAIERSPTAPLDPLARVRAPIGGTVLERAVGLGQFITSGASKPVYTIGDLSTVWLVAAVREADAGRVRVGAPVRIRVLAYPGRVFNARISWVAPTIDPKTHRLPVRADIDNKDGALKPMMFARFTIATGPPRMAPAVPEEAIIHRGDSERVWVAEPDGSLAARRIETGESRGGMVEVLSGLKAGERVLTAGSLFIDRAASGG
jgi:membrane fusion protein, heavy metal efflux system